MIIWRLCLCPNAIVSGRVHAGHSQQAAAPAHDQASGSANGGLCLSALASGLPFRQALSLRLLPKPESIINMSIECANTEERSKKHTVLSRGFLLMCFGLLQQRTPRAHPLIDKPIVHLKRETTKRVTWERRTRGNSRPTQTLTHLFAGDPEAGGQTSFLEVFRVRIFLPFHKHKPSDDRYSKRLQAVNRTRCSTMCAKSHLRRPLPARGARLPASSSVTYHNRS
jgi:hypothetical protein